MSPSSFKQTKVFASLILKVKFYDLEFNYLKYIRFRKENITKM